MIKKRAITLIEIMVVVFFIGIIGSLLAVNMKKTMEKGKVFKTQQAQKQIYDILLLELAKDNSLTVKIIAEHPAKYLARSGLIKDVNNFLKDGWGESFKITTINHDTDIAITSKNLKDCEAKEKKDEEDFE